MKNLKKTAAVDISYFGLFGVNFVCKYWNGAKIDVNDGNSYIMFQSAFKEVSVK